MQDLSIEDLLKKVHDLETEGKILNKLNRNKDSFHVSKDVVDAFPDNILEKTPARFHDSFFETPAINQTDSLIHLADNLEVLQYLILIS